MWANLPLELLQCQLAARYIQLLYLAPASSCNEQWIGHALIHFALQLKFEAVPRLLPVRLFTLPIVLSASMRPLLTLTLSAI